MPGPNIGRAFCLRISNLLLVVTLCSSCVGYESTGTREVDDGTSRIGSVSETLKSFGMLRIVSYPTKSNPIISFKVEKYVEVKIQYIRKSHKEIVLKRNASRTQRAFEKVNKTLNQNAIAGILEFALVPFALLGDILPYTPSIGEETRYKRIENSEIDDVFFEYKTEKKAGAGEGFSVQTFGHFISDEDGLVQFTPRPEEFSDGITVYHRNSGSRFLIMSERKESTSRAEWYPFAKTANVIFQIGAMIRRIRTAKNIIDAGGGPITLASAIVVDAVSGMVIGFIIDYYSKTTNEYYQWSVIRVS